MKNILVTGGAGFIGQHLCRALLAQGNSVVCLDNFYSSTRSGTLNMGENYSFLMHDIRIPLPTYLIQRDFDQIYNLACPASPVAYQRDPVFTHQTCARGIERCIEMAIQKGARLLHTSTSEIYGDSLIHPQGEDYWGNVNPWGVRSCYDEGKRFAETVCHDYIAKGADIKVARIFNTYGPHMDPNDGRVISNFVNQALRGEPLTIYGDGTQTRSFCYVDDMVSGLIKLMDSDIKQPVNLGNPTEFTMNQLVTVLQDLFAKQNRGSVECVHCPLPQDDPKKRKPDITLAEQLLDWKPKVTLEQGLEKTLEHFALEHNNEQQL